MRHARESDRIVGCLRFRRLAAREFVVCAVVAGIAACGPAIGEPAESAFPRFRIEGESVEEIEAFKVRIDGEHIDPVEERVEVDDQELVFELPAGDSVTVELHTLESDGEQWRAGLFRGAAETPVLQAGEEMEIAVPLQLPQPAGADGVTWAAAATAGSYAEFGQAIDDFLDVDAGEDEAFLLLVNDDIDVGSVGEPLSAAAGADIYIIGESLDEAELVTLDGGGDSGILGAESAADGLTFHVGGLRFVNGMADGGGALFVGSGYSRLMVFESEFEDNLASANDGGAIWFFGEDDVPENEVVVSQSVFANNETVSNGGAMLIDGDALVEVAVHESEFIDNEAGNTGGAIAVWPVEALDISDSIFRRNDALTGDGGAVYAEVITGTGVYVDSTAFESNSAGEDTGTGGAVVVVEATELEIRDSHFSSNEAMQGGAVVGTVVPTIDVTDSVFEQNSSIEYGGAIVGEEFDRIRIARSRFEENVAGEGGGVAAVEASPGELETEQSSYINNDEPPLFDGFETLTDGGGNEFEPDGHEPTWGEQGE